MLSVENEDIIFQRRIIDSTICDPDLVKSLTTFLHFLWEVSLRMFQGVSKVFFSIKLVQLRLSLSLLLLI